MKEEIKTFNQLYQEYQPRFVRFANTYVRSIALSEDIAIEAIMYYWENKYDLAEDSNVPAYILNIIKHKCLNHLRHQQIREEYAQSVQDYNTWELNLRISTLQACEPDELFTAEMQEIVDRTLNKLPKQTHQVFRMSRYGITVFLLMACAFCIHAEETHSQNARVSIRMNSVKLDQILDAIETQTDYLFIYNNQVNTNSKSSIKVKNESVAQVLNDLLKDKDITYKMEGTHIILTKQAGAQSNQAWQQTQTLTGVVVDAKEEPIIGANIHVKGTTVGVITDLNGNFTIEADPKSTLEITYIGYLKQEMVVGTQKHLRVVLIEDAKSLDEVVVIGYGIQKKANLSGSVVSVDSKELQNRPIQNLTSGLQGLMPGVTITGTNGSPGMESGTIRVRGTGTLNTASPYILIDGIESETLNAVDPNDIESISVLKDAASAAIYGSKASNGVILITTKRGKSGKPQVSYSGYVSFQNATNMVERLSSLEYASMYNKTTSRKSTEWNTGTRSGYSQHG